MKTLSEIIDLYGAKRNGSKEWRAFCPAHADDTPSLDITKKNGRIVFYCRSTKGCKSEDILAAKGLNFADVCADSGNAAGHSTNRSKYEKRQIEKIYDYRDDQKSSSPSDRSL